MNDRPSAGELLEAVARFLREDVVAALEGPGKYQARVAANVVSIVRRELESEERHLRGEWRRLGELLEGSQPLPSSLEALRTDVRGRTEQLVQAIRAGRADQGRWRERLVAHLEQTVADKLEVAKPAPRRPPPRSD